MAPASTLLARWATVTQDQPLQRRKSSLAASQKMKALAEAQHADDVSGGSGSESKRSAGPSKQRPPSPTKRLAQKSMTRRDANASDGELEYQVSDGDDEKSDIAGPSQLADPSPVSKKRKVATNKHNKEGKKKGGEAALYAKLVHVRGRGLASPCAPPTRAHELAYHCPLLLDADTGRSARDRLLSWFDRVASSRKMPWRKEWINPTKYEDQSNGKANDDSAEVNGALRQALERRAYEVWISEIMLQQTRVSVVIDYWNKWMDKWPTIHDLARAEPDDVLSAWRGLGYYSRATRIHEAAKKVVNDCDLNGMLPSSASELEAKVPGVGRYTAGAISSIVFGVPSPMVDGNVLRVLSRQLGLYGNVKTSKAVIDVLWVAADALVKAVAHDDPQASTGAAESLQDDAAIRSNRPGRWGQALMELGSTVCTPKPDCTVCPIKQTCRAFAEGRVVAAKRAFVAASDTPPVTDIADIEDLCTLCEPFESHEDDDNVPALHEHAEAVATNKRKDGKRSVCEPFESHEDDDNVPALHEHAEAVATNKRKDGKRSVGDRQSTLATFAFTQAKDKSGSKAHVIGKSKSAELSSQAVEIIIEHARKFPVKVVKKAVREEETLVCAIYRASDERYLLRRRPDKGLLAGLWEFSSSTLPEDTDSKPEQRKADALAYAQQLVKDDGSSANALRHIGELGSVPWLFSHLKLTMHVHLFVLQATAPPTSSSKAKKSCQAAMRWASAADVERESMGTGMRKCWALARDAHID